MREIKAFYSSLFNFYRTHLSATNNSKDPYTVISSRYSLYKGRVQELIGIVGHIFSSPQLSLFLEICLVQLKLVRNQYMFYMYVFTLSRCLDSEIDLCLCVCNIKKSPTKNCTVNMYMCKKIYCCQMDINEILKLSCLCSFFQLQLKISQALYTTSVISMFLLILSWVHATNMLICGNGQKQCISKSDPLLEVTNYRKMSSLASSILYWVPLKLLVRVFH